MTVKERMAIRKIFILAIAVSIIIFGLSAQALAVPFTCVECPPPNAFVQIDGSDPINVPLTQNTLGQFLISNFRTELNGNVVTIPEATLSPDPSIAYAFGVVDFGAPSIFGFFFFTPIAPTGAPNVVFASLAGGFIDVDGLGYSFTPVPGPLAQVSEVHFPATNMGVDVGPAFAAGAAPPGTPYVYGPFTDGPQPGPGPGPWTGLSTSLVFSLAGGGDTAALTGFASIEEVLVPEPSALLLLGSGLAGLALFGRKRRSTKQ